MFSEKSKIRIEKEFRELAEELTVLQDEVIAKLEALEENITLAMKYLYITMPLSDIGNYPFETFLDYAKQGIKLWENGVYSEKIPEEIFLNYVLFHRINEEEILPCRTYFYDKLKTRVQGLTMKEAILEVNYWCAEEATYQSTDNRTVAPITVFNCAHGRCGEESTFAVSVLRSIGIPARQVYVPKWSHCDDNHAWVEAWCEGTWFFFGACEPEEILNKGWFTNASSRAMLAHSRRFDVDMLNDVVIGQDGMVTMINQLERYAITKSISIKIIDEDANPIKDVKVNFEIVNYSEFTSIATLLTDQTGTVTLKVGLGTVHIQVIAQNGMFAEILLDTRTQSEDTIVLKEEVMIENGAENSWKAFDMIAPKDSPINTNMENQQQKLSGKEKYIQAVNKRLMKVKSLQKKEIDTFLNTDYSTRILKEKMLSVLTTKDQYDCKAEILEEHFKYALPYLAQTNEKIFFNYILNPRILDEPMTKYRAFICDYFTNEEKDSFKDHPELIWNWIEKRIQSRDEREHSSVITSPVGCLKLGIGSSLSKKTLFVAIARTIGLPARLNPNDNSIEYCNKEEFIPIFKNAIKSASLLISGDDRRITWSYYQNWTIARYEKGEYTSLKLANAVVDKVQLKLSLEPGKYRIITSNRLPNGNIFANQYITSVKEGEEKNVVLSLREANLFDMLGNISLRDFSLKKEDGVDILGSEITKQGKVILFWLEEGKEPTEHILNELLERKEEFIKYSSNLVFIVRNQKTLEDILISKVLALIPNIRIYYDTYEDNVQTLGRRMYVDPDKLPLIIVTHNELNGIYATSGYNVGTGDMLLRLLREGGY